MVSGYVYIVGSIDFKRVKVGYWKSTISKLRGRYVTCYGNDLILDVFPTSHPEQLEKAFQYKFVDYCVCCEMYKIDGTDLYKEFLTTHRTKTLQELAVPKNTRSVRQEFNIFLQENNLDYIITPDYHIGNHTKENYKALANYDSNALKSILEKVKSMPQQKIKSRIRRAIIHTLYTFIVIRRYIELTESVEQFQTAKTISVSDRVKKQLAEKLVDEDGEMYLNAMKYVLETKLKTPNEINPSSNIHKIIRKVFPLLSDKRRGSHKKGYSTYVMTIDIPA